MFPSTKQMLSYPHCTGAKRAECCLLLEVDKVEMSVIDSRSFGPPFRDVLYEPHLQQPTSAD